MRVPNYGKNPLSLPNSLYCPFYNDGGPKAPHGIKVDGFLYIKANVACKRLSHLALRVAEELGAESTDAITYKNLVVVRVTLNYIQHLRNVVIYSEPPKLNACMGFIKSCNWAWKIHIRYD